MSKVLDFGVPFTSGAWSHLTLVFGLSLTLLLALGRLWRIGWALIERHGLSKRPSTDRFAAIDVRGREPRGFRLALIAACVLAISVARMFVP